MEYLGIEHLQFLAEQINLCHLGGQIMPTTVLQAPRIFRPCDGPDTRTLTLFVPNIFHTTLKNEQVSAGVPLFKKTLLRPLKFDRTVRK